MLIFLNICLLYTSFLFDYVYQNNKLRLCFLPKVQPSTLRCTSPYLCRWEKYCILYWQNYLDITRSIIQWEKRFSGLPHRGCHLPLSILCHNMELKLRKRSQIFTGTLNFSDFPFKTNDIYSIHILLVPVILNCILK